MLQVMCMYVCMYLNTCRKTMSIAYMKLPHHVVRVRVADKINKTSLILPILSQCVLGQVSQETVSEKELCIQSFIGSALRSDT